MPGNSRPDSTRRHALILSRILGTATFLGSCETSDALLSARVFNQLHPFLVGANMLTVCPDSALHQEIKNGNWQEASELEKYTELHALVANLAIPTHFAALGASNAIPLSGTLPRHSRFSAFSHSTKSPFLLEYSHDPRKDSV